jgi:hypothetical protein
MELTLDMTRRYTYADYLTWIDDKRRELIDGFIKMMSPTPALSHSRVEGRIYATLPNLTGAAVWERPT